MIKLYSGGKTVKHAVRRPYDPGYYVIPKNTEYCYEPTEQTLLAIQKSNFQHNEDGVLMTPPSSNMKG